MASENRTENAAVDRLATLSREPHKFGFFSALRLLECAYRDQPRLGRSQRAGDDAVRLTQEPSLAFAPSAVSSFEPRAGDAHPRLSVLYPGLFGPNGPLPLHLTEHARDRIRNSDDPTFARFADIFHHRILGLFYRAWADAQPAVHFDRPEADRFGVYVASLLGIGSPALRDRDEMPDLAKLHNAGTLTRQSRPAEGLRGMLAHYFELPVEIVEFVGRWLELPDDARWRLSEPPGGILGSSTHIGTGFWDAQHRFGVVLGPMDFSDFQRMLPGGDSLRRLVALVRNYVGEEFAWDLHLILRMEEIPPMRLGEPRRLGWSTWLQGEPDADDDNVSFDPEIAVAHAAVGPGVSR